MELTEKMLKKAVEIAPVLLWGPPGMGKTYIAHAVLGEDAPVHWCMPSDGRPEAMGHYIIGKDGVFEWQEGQVARGMRVGKLIINEAHEAGEELTVCLLWALDNQDTRCVVTMNGSPETLHPALLSRLPFRIHVPEPTKGLAAAVRRKAKEVGNKLGFDGAVLSENIIAAIANRQIDPRGALAMLKAMREYGFDEGLEVVNIIHPALGGTIEALVKGPEATV